MESDRVNAKKSLLSYRIARVHELQEWGRVVEAQRVGCLNPDFGNGVVLGDDEV